MLSPTLLPLVVVIVVAVAVRRVVGGGRPATVSGVISSSSGNAAIMDVRFVIRRRPCCFDCCCGTDGDMLLLKVFDVTSTLYRNGIIDFVMREREREKCYLVGGGTNCVERRRKRACDNSFAI